MNQVFLSYHSENEVTAKEIELWLTEAGFDVWRDQYSIRHSADDWSKEIELGIWNSFALVVLLTPKAIERPWILYEMIFAVGARKPIIVVTLEPTELTAVHPKFAFKQYLDFEQRNDLVDELRNIKSKVASTSRVAFELEYLREKSEKLALLHTECASLTGVGVGEAFARTLSPSRFKVMTAQGEAIMLTIGDYELTQIVKNANDVKQMLFDGLVRISTLMAEVRTKLDSE